MLWAKQYRDHFLRPRYLSEELLSLDYGSALLDTDGAWVLTVRLAAESSRI